MGKKNGKKKKDREFNILDRYDNRMASNWDDLMNDIESMTESIKKDDKRRKKSKMYFNEPSVARSNVIGVFKDTSFLDLVDYALKNAGTLVKIIARLVATLILLLLSCDFIRKMIPPAMMDKIKGIYSFAMAV